MARRPKEILTGEGTTPVHQTEMEGPGFEQERIPALERQADKRAEKEAIIEGLNDEIKTIDFKIREIVHANEDKLQREEDPVTGVVTFTYQRATYKVTVKTGKESVKVDAGKQTEKVEE